MIIVKLMGGLGNQLFQYAFGRRLAIGHNVALKLDVSQLNMNLGAAYTMRDPDLNAFAIKASLASEAELEKYKKGKAGKVLDLIRLNLPVKMDELYIREPHFYFYSKALKAPAECYLDGYWQSENYFSEIRPELLKELQPLQLSEETKLLAEKIRRSNAVSVHIRRGDYISIESNKSLYETCDEQYYLRAMEKISGTTADPVFYIFSDEPEWFREHVKTDHQVVYVDHNRGKNSYQDLYLMSQCRHNIIANSSFSWWGAWLNDNGDKQVIAPAKWFRNNSKNTKDLIPPAWIRL